MEGLLYFPPGNVDGTALLEFFALLSFPSLIVPEPNSLLDSFH